MFTLETPIRLVSDLSVRATTNDFGCDVNLNLSLFERLLMTSAAMFTSIFHCSSNINDFGCDINLNLSLFERLLKTSFAMLTSVLCCSSDYNDFVFDVTTPQLRIVIIILSHQIVILLNSDFVIRILLSGATK